MNNAPVAIAFFTNAMVAALWCIYSVWLADYQTDYKPRHAR